MRVSRARKALTAARAVALARRLQRRGRVVVFTNGCFDLLHAGHVELLEAARAHGDFLVVGVNSDRSVRRLKGPGRPIVPLPERMEILAALRAVDCVVGFGEATPARLISRLRPDVLVKGSDYRKREIVGRDTVEALGGRVVRVPLRRGLSTSGLIRRVLRPPVLRG
ncbi:MAG TPA: D-glycero-beta-D-manno-heptose 1-phosphate adenylyltransferase [Candidatus Polarisedimenticolia bacterium]|jgi:D-beta-D-heptose 7-phosphate kinase/D-beta-D-heptose 1-phosphate adenosyltransferase|nr:D-glycero-beta-D-manno-heptose 1-phosphate adenylyltransferase [Candidatus Polarisedimenticolia bacterium]